MAKNSETLDETNYRSFAIQVINKYQSMGRVVDAVVWGRIVGLYEAELKKLGGGDGGGEAVSDPQAESVEP